MGEILGRVHEHTYPKPDNIPANIVYRCECGGVYRLVNSSTKYWYEYTGPVDTETQIGIMPTDITYPEYEFEFDPS